MKCTSEEFGADNQPSMILGTKGTAAYISPILMDSIKNFTTEKNADGDKALLKWIVHCGSERFLLDLSIIMGHTKLLYKELDISPHFGWFSRFWQ
jgi:hypothetical protein